MENITKELYVNIAANLILIALGALYRKGRAILERLNPLARPLVLVGLFLIFLSSNVAFSFYFQKLFSLLYLTTSTVILGWIFYQEIEVFWRLGVIGGDRTIASGVNYRRALKMCEDSMEFLGIGASKLTAEGDVFRNAIARCHRDNRPVRFLLCPPDSEQLMDLAKRAGRPTSEYQANVKRSLSEIRELKVNHSRNIEVKFYSELPLFRLMFVNDKICLASHYILGEGSGSQLPQLHVLRNPPGRRDIESLYHPLHLYFEQLWEKANQWDFKKFL